MIGPFINWVWAGLGQEIQQQTQPSLARFKSGLGSCRAKISPGLGWAENFSISSAWSTIRSQKPKNDTFEQIWNKSIPPSVSIFVWRLIQNRNPTDENMQGRSIQIASKCRCCWAPSTESREHLFLGSGTARLIWNHFSKWFPDSPLQGDNLEVADRLQVWKANALNLSAGLVSSILPLLILWNILVERKETTFNSAQVINRVYSFLQWCTASGMIKRNQWEGCNPGNRISLLTIQRS